MTTALFFGVGLGLWAALGLAFAAHFVRERHLLDAVSAVACILCGMGPARELKLLPNYAATPLYVAGLFVACGGLCAVVVYAAQRRRGHR